MARAQHSALRQGVMAGIIGAAIVAGWFLIYDIGRVTWVCRRSRTGHQGRRERERPGHAGQ